MAEWFPAALLALFSFGLWGLFTKLSISYIDIKSALVYQVLGVLSIGIIALGFLHFKPATDTKGLSFGILTGIAYALGCFFYFMAVDKGKVITVVTLTALYPIVTILLAYLFLKEGVNLKQMFGVLVALFAIYLLSS